MGWGTMDKGERGNNTRRAYWPLTDMGLINAVNNDVRWFLAHTTIQGLVAVERPALDDGGQCRANPHRGSVTHLRQTRVGGYRIGTERSEDDPHLELQRRTMDTKRRCTSHRDCTRIAGGRRNNI